VSIKNNHVNKFCFCQIYYHILDEWEDDAHGNSKLQAIIQDPI